MGICSVLSGAAQCLATYYGLSNSDRHCDLFPRRHPAKTCGSGASRAREASRRWQARELDCARKLTIRWEQSPIFYLARNDDDLTQLQSYLEHAEAGLRRISVITNQTLRFHRQAASKQPIQATNLLGSILALHEGRLRNASITLERRDKASDRFEAFEGEIRQVLSNLIANATDAMHKTGGRLLIRSRNGTDPRSGQWGVMITVADTGEGMTPQTIQKVFEAFFSTKEAKGTGLGLWITKNIVDRHGKIVAPQLESRQT
jgi:signal transduction histidine kinase